MPLPISAQLITGRGLAQFPWLRQPIFLLIFLISGEERAFGMVNNRYHVVETNPDRAELRTFTGGIAKVLDSPLKAILTLCEQSLECMEKNNPVGEKMVLENLAEIERSAWQCMEVLRVLEIYSQTSSVQFEPENLNAILTDVTLMLEAKFKNEASIFLHKELEPGLPPLSCNHSQIMQMVYNLLINARDAMPNGGTISLSTSYDPFCRTIVLRISDTGIGIPREMIERIFDPFFSNKPFDRGTGLGLSVVFGIVQIHRGQIRVDSQPHQGTTFFITLPISSPASTSSL
jgi:signal transduction histidine kinase